MVIDDQDSSWGLLPAVGSAADRKDAHLTALIAAIDRRAEMRRRGVDPDRVLARRLGDERDGMEIHQRQRLARERKQAAELDRARRALAQRRAKARRGRR